MKPDDRLTRRRLFVRGLAAAGALALAGCERLTQTTWFPKILAVGEQASRASQRLLLTRKSMAQEFTDADRSPTFRSNGTSVPRNPQYMALAANGFADYRLEVGGLVEHPQSVSLAELKAMPSRTQITRHDCVEGWSAIAKWKGTPLHLLLDKVVPKPNARYVVFYCADPMEPDGSSPYYESVDMDDAYHPQTILAYEVNDQTLPVPNGAPVRVRVERQLGYKMAKYIMRIELVESFDRIAGGHGGYWEDQGYEWYAGV